MTFSMDGWFKFKNTRDEPVKVEVFADETTNNDYWCTYVLPGSEMASNPAKVERIILTFNAVAEAD